MTRLRPFLTDLLRGLLLAALVFHAAAAAVPAPARTAGLRAVTCLGAAIPGPDGEAPRGAHAACLFCCIGEVSGPLPSLARTALPARIPRSFAPGPASPAPIAVDPTARGPPVLS